MKTIMRNLFVLLLLGGVTGLAMADSPTTLQKPDSHSIVAKGKLTVFRVQMPGLNFGTELDKLDSNVLVALDSAPDMVFGVRTSDDSHANEAMIETLWEAYLENLPVIIHYQIAPGKNHVKINVVHLER